MAAVQIGTKLKIGFGGNTYANTYAEEVTVSKPNGNVEVIKDELGATLTKILMDPGTKISGTFVLADAASIDPPAEGDTVTIGTVTGYCESAEAKFKDGATRLTMTIIKEDSMTYT